MTDDTTIPADLITPLGAYLRLRGDTPSFLLESVDQGRLGRYSLLGSGAPTVSFADAEHVVGTGVPVVGFVGYDLVNVLEPTVLLPADGPELPGEAFIAADVLVRFDHLQGTAEVLHGDADLIAERLAQPAPEPTSPRGPSRPAPTSRSPSQAEYEAGVRRAKEYIRLGDAFQIVLSQRARRPTPATPIALYRALRRINPSPYLFLLELDGIALVGSSPETLVKLEGTRASLNPIAGTARLDRGDAERLLASEKDRAEHIMLVDLGRNDLSRVCEAGTVHVERFLDVERYSHVIHLVSEVAGVLKPGLSGFDLLRAGFPAGTVSGAPKVRAMQIISELEGYRRGPYAGAVGYGLPDGDLDTCIGIRTIVLADGIAHLQAGAGIVADSDPASEHEECLNKLAALERAIELAERA
ncbi:MAG: anthranilate synthase component I family protein [Actinomycetia bacterium]|nr:anthranilate synthase component I family protein [Actinomycetes bacterium]